MLSLWAKMLLLFLLRIILNPNTYSNGPGGGQPLIQTFKKTFHSVCNWTNQIACFGILQKSDEADSHIWHLRPELSVWISTVCRQQSCLLCLTLWSQLIALHSCRRKAKTPCVDVSGQLTRGHPFPSPAIKQVLLRIEGIERPTKWSIRAEWPPEANFFMIKPHAVQASGRYDADGPRFALGLDPTLTYLMTAIEREVSSSRSRV